MGAYYEYLERHGVFYDADRDHLKATGLHVICDMTGSVEIFLRSAASDVFPLVASKEKPHDVMYAAGL